MEQSDNRRQTRLICAALALAVVAAYWPVWRCGFVDFDDDDYVFNNDAIQHGPNWRAIKWAFTTTHAANWHPLTWISHILDFQLYGLNAAGHHATSLLLHAINSIFLFVLLKRMTRMMWPAAVTAALFALHPMHVESVAWIAERKDVLSTFFWMLSVWAYLRYVEGSRLFYAGSLAFFAMALMCKPMVVTLPCLLLLLDYWPLERFRHSAPGVWVEKIPYFVLAALTGVVTIVAQRRGGTVLSLAHLPLAARLENLPMSYARYVAKLFWPRHLAVLYPYVLTWPAWEVIGACIFLVAITVFVIGRAHSQPFLAVGWMWFLIGLAPVNGLLQTGVQSMADRYTYIPSIGLFIMVVWSLDGCGEKLGRYAEAFLAIAVLAGCFFLTERQVGYWKDTRTLFAHALESTKDNYIACEVLGRHLALHGQRAAAIGYLDKAVAIAPWFAPAQNDLGRVLLDAGHVDDALPHLEQAVALMPRVPENHYNLGNALLAKRRVAEALEQFQIEVNLRPEDAVAQRNFGEVLLGNNLVDDAIPHLEKATAINPSDADARFNLGNAYFQKGRAADAAREYEISLRFRPDFAPACNNLAWILSSNPASAIRNGPKAVELASRADRLAGGNDPVVAGTLAVAFAESGKFPEAIATALRAQKLAEAKKDFALVKTLDQRLKLFQAGLPFRDTAPKGRN
jgi:tetratricopeptide (TPR) repeat protein